MQNLERIGEKYITMSRIIILAQCREEIFVPSTFTRKIIHVNGRIKYLQTVGNDSLKSTFTEIFSNR